MLILVFLAPFFIAIAWLVYIDSSNTEDIKKYISKNECENTIYYQSKYQTLCKNGVVVILNQFSIDFSSNEIIKYKNIKKLKIDKKSIIVNNKDEDLTLVFENEKQVKKFEKELRKKINE